MVHSDVYAELIRKQQQIDAQAERIADLERSSDAWQGMYNRSAERMAALEAADRYPIYLAQTKRIAALEEAVEAARFLLDDGYSIWDVDAEPHLKRLEAALAAVSQ